MRVAAYARYSSDAQREASLEDQLRNCRAYATREGWRAPEVFTDAAISGARQDRPGYRALLEAAHRFDVILVDDLSRLSRDSVECQQAVRRLTFAGVRLIGVSDGVDTGRKSHKADVGLRGLMSELYLDDLAEKTHRGQAGRALAGASAGGLPYGYQVAGVGERAIDEAEAAVVRRIYADFIAGRSPREIAKALNAEGVPSPRGGTWALTAIRGDPRRGIGILANPIYVGRQIWNRSRWVKHPETGRRIRQERPESEWVVTECPELAIVTPEQWEAAQQLINGRKRPGTANSGRPPRHLLSGLLRCGCCGGPLVVVDRYRYGCARAKDRGTCREPVHVPIRDAEAAMLAGIREQLLSDDAFQRFQRAVKAALQRQAPDTAAARRRLQGAQRERDNIMAAIRQGIITPSTKAALQAAEAAVADAEREIAAAAAVEPARILPRARERYQALVADLGNRARGNTRAREAVATLIGTATVTKENGDLVAEIAASRSQITVVAGAGFEPATFGL
ncbi:recombinase family protein [Luteimonas sp. JM171]|uniref:recombinase family protein n=1 Tax=Luteimonas sp. JM171 TaxID=1896164 RepID=UPI000BA306C7